MLPKFEYSEFHKFLVSVGAVLSGASLGIPFFVLRNQKTLMISEREIRELPQPAQQSIRSQQEQLHWLVAAWPWASGALLAMGVTFVVLGGVRWKARQDHLNQVAVAELDKIQAERDKTHAEIQKTREETKDLLKKSEPTPDEANKVRKEKIEKEIADISAELNSLQRKRPARSNSEKSVGTVALNSYFLELEETVARLLGKVFDENDEVFADVEIGSGRRVDFVVLSRTASDLSAMIEVKAIPEASLRKNLRNRLDEIVSWSICAKAAGKTRFGRTFRPIALFVIAQQAALIDGTRTAEDQVNVDTSVLVSTAEQVESYIDAIREEIPDLRIVVTSLDNLRRASPFDVMKIINSKSSVTVF